MFRRILVPVDGSKTAAAGLRAGIALARKHKARLRLVHLAHVVLAPPVPGGFAVADLYELIQQAGRKVLAKAQGECRRRGVPCETRMVVGVGERAAAVIVRDAAKWRADLIVMGTHGRRGIRRLALGSDAEQVARAARVPVLLVKR
jgi:nucleotide-binding universal stress UspA family protein